MPRTEGVGQSFGRKDGAANFPQHVFGFTAPAVGPIRIPKCGFSQSFTQGFSLSFTQPWVLLLTFYPFPSFMTITHAS